MRDIRSTSIDPCRAARLSPVRGRTALRARGNTTRLLPRTPSHGTFTRAVLLASSQRHQQDLPSLRRGRIRRGTIHDSRLAACGRGSCVSRRRWIGVAGVACDRRSLSRSCGIYPAHRCGHLWQLAGSQRHPSSAPLPVRTRWLWSWRLWAARRLPLRLRLVLVLGLCGRDWTGLHLRHFPTQLRARALLRTHGNLVLAAAGAVLLRGVFHGREGSAAGRRSRGLLRRRLPQPDAANRACPPREIWDRRRRLAQHGGDRCKEGLLATLLASPLEHDIAGCGGEPCEDREDQANDHPGGRAAVGGERCAHRATTGDRECGRRGGQLQRRRHWW